MKAWNLAISAALLAATSSASLADTTSEVLFRHKNWMVEGVTYDDGSLACIAELDDPNDTFMIFAYPDGLVSLRFYNASWDFGDSGDTADLQIQIDRRSPWTASNARLSGQSVDFDLPGNDDAVNFLLEVAHGQWIYLRTATGDDVQNYSLSGSSASISALVDCGNAISNDTNPFK